MVLDFNWYRAITQCTGTVNILTTKLGAKIVRKGILPRRSVAFLQLWPNGWMDQDKEVGLGPGHIVLDGDPAPSPHSSLSPLFGPCLLWPNSRPSQQLLSSCKNQAQSECKHSLTFNVRRYVVMGTKHALISNPPNNAQLSYRPDALPDTEPTVSRH